MKKQPFLILLVSNKSSHNRALGFENSKITSNIQTLFIKKKSWIEDESYVFSDYNAKKKNVILFNVYVWNIYINIKEKH